MKKSKTPLSKFGLVAFQICIILSAGAIAIFFFGGYVLYASDPMKAAFYVLSISNVILSWINVTRPLGDGSRAKRIICMFFISVLILALPLMVNLTWFVSMLIVFTQG